MTDIEQFVVELPVFEGPLDLLLTLIERRELPVTELSISKVTGDYLATITAIEQVQPEELRWFIDVGGKLIAHKTRALSQTETDEEPDDFARLTEQVKRYGLWRQLAAGLAGWYGSPLANHTLQRQSISNQQSPPNLSPSALQRARGRVGRTRSGSSRARHSVRITRAQLRQTMQRLLNMATQKRNLHEHLGNGSRRERAINLIAVLELIKEDMLDILHEPGGVYVKAQS